jgi:oligopeptidase A
MNNPLLSMSGLPPFSKIKPENVEPAIDKVLAENRAKLESLLNKTADQPCWDNLIQPLEEMEDYLSRVWSPVRHMNSVVNSEVLREAYNKCLPKLSAYGTEVGQNKGLYKAYKFITKSDEFSLLTSAKKKTINNALRDFHLSGVDLSDEKKLRFKQIAQRLSELSAKFEENVLDATQAWEKQCLDPIELAGLPESALEMSSQTARQREKKGWLLTLEFPSYHAVITYADDRSLREEIYRAYTTRASNKGNNSEWDNSSIMEEILALRHEVARLLGFSNYAERSLATKMAETPDQVMDFLTNLADKSRPQAQEEMQELYRFAKGVLGIMDVQAWDIAYISEKMKGAYYDLSQEDLKPYFPVDKVIAGMFDLVQQLYGIGIKEKKGVDTWHPDVRFYEIFSIDGELKAQFFFDLYARPKKRGGAWMDECISRMQTARGIQNPVAYMTCNSTPPVGDKPALFTHNEVITLFHEFGHGLHHMLTNIGQPSVSGISGVEWDAVELPSQFMENWCWEREALDLFAAHFEKGEKIPEALYEKLIDSKNFQSAMQMVRQLEFSIFDLRIHQEFNPEEGTRIQEILDEVRSNVAVLIPPEFNRFQHGFSHIFGGGYAAGYYSYKWAEVLSADAYARFEEEGLFDKRVGEAFLTNILEVGGSRDAMDSFKAFRGREPKIDALLRHCGIAA